MEGIDNDMNVVNKYDNIRVIEINAKEDFDFSKNRIKNTKFQNKLGLLKVYAPWCGHCTNMIDTMYELAKDLQDEQFVVAALNSDKSYNKDLVRLLEVSGFPSLFMIKDNGEIDKEQLEILGERDAANILDAISKRITKYMDKN